MREALDAQHRAAFLDRQRSGDLVVGQNGVDGNIRMAERYAAVVLQNQENVARDEVCVRETFAENFG